MPSSTANGTFAAIKACVTCFPKPKVHQPSPLLYSSKYSAQVRLNLNLPDPAIQLPRVEVDPNGRVTTIDQYKPEASPSLRSLNPPDMLEEPGSAMTARGRHIRQRFPTVIKDDPRSRWSTATLTAPQLAELFAAIHDTLEHVPYAICGLGALFDHGFTTRRLNRVTILCPAYAKDNVRAWLATRGYDCFADSAGIPISAGMVEADGEGKGKGKGKGKDDGKSPSEGGDGQIIVRTRIKFLADGFEKLERTPSRMSSGWVLGLASQADHAAAGFVDHYRRLEQLQKKQKQQDAEDKLSSNFGKRSKEDRERIQKRALELRQTELGLKTIAHDIFWCLAKARSEKHPLPEHLLPTLLGKEFWDPFTRRHEEARTEMAAAGIDVQKVLARHNAEEMVAEHRAMLKEYGVQDYEYAPGRDSGVAVAADDGNGFRTVGVVGVGGAGVIAEQPGPFEGMRTLAHNNKSVYSLSPDRSRGGSEASTAAAEVLSIDPTRLTDVPPVPPLPLVIPTSKGKFLGGLLSRKPSQEGKKSKKKSKKAKAGSRNKSPNDSGSGSSGSSSPGGAGKKEQSLGRSLTRKKSSASGGASRKSTEEKPSAERPVPEQRFSADVERPAAQWI